MEKEWAIIDNNGQILKRDFKTEKDAIEQRDREIYFGNYDYNNSTVTYFE